jgi:hypothetical protein
MSAPDLLRTALLLGVYVALAGLYGLAYAVARLRAAPLLRYTAATAYALHALIGAAVVAWAPLQVGWKGLIIASSAAVLVIPPLMWRLLQLSHEAEAER